MSDGLDAAFCVETLNAALAGRGQPEILNTDQSSQFAGCNFTGALKGADVVFPWTAGADAWTTSLAGTGESRPIVLVHP